MPEANKWCSFSFLFSAYCRVFFWLLLYAGTRFFHDSATCTYLTLSLKTWSGCWINYSLASVQLLATDEKSGSVKSLGNAGFKHSFYKSEFPTKGHSGPDKNWFSIDYLINMWSITHLGSNFVFTLTNCSDFWVLVYLCGTRSSTSAMLTPFPGIW